MKIGQRIINEIVKQGMVQISHPDPDQVHVFAWKPNASDQLDALIQSVSNHPPLPAPAGSADERAILVNAVEWLAIEVSRHGDKCTCGSCHAVAACADIIEAKNSKYIANTIRRQLAARNPQNHSS